MTEGWLERDGVRLHYLEWGGGDGIPFLLLHGLSSNARFWDRTAQRLAGHRVVALDQRSHGASDRPQSGYSHDVLVADAVHAIRELGLGRPVVAGHSWGAAVALELAGTRPGDLAGLGIIDGPVWPMSERFSWDEAQKMMQPPLPRYVSVDEAAAASRAYLKSGWDDDLVPFVQAGLVQEGDAWVPTLTAPVRFEILRSLYHYHPELLWPLVEVPVMVIAAQSGSPIDEYRRRSVEAVGEIRPDLVVRWYRTDHDVPLYQPDEVAADLARLAARAEWSGLNRDLSALDGDWQRPIGAGDWSAHDLLAHLSSTQAALTPVIRAQPEPAQARGSDEPSPPREPFDPDRWNASQVRRRLEVSSLELREEFQRGTAELEAMLAEEDLERVISAGPYAGGPLRDYLRFMRDHQRTHLDELRKALA